MTVLARRALLGGLGGAALLAQARPVWAAVAAASPASARPLPASPLLDCLCDLTIPDTDTPGAKAAGVPAFVTLAVAHGLERAPPDLLVRLAALLDGPHGQGGFLAAPAAARQATLAAIDARAFANHAPTPPDLLPWATAKALIVMGYYTSEIGGAHELAYELVPGRWEPDVPLKPGDRAWSSDWTALEFG